MTAMRVLVTGRGSIAQRHVRHLRELLPDVVLAVVSSTGEVAPSLLPCVVFGDVDSAFGWNPDAVVIASISSRHAHELERCLRLRLPCLVEKPLVIHRDELSRLCAVAAQLPPIAATVVGCNLRYLPALQQLRRALNGAAPGRVVRAQFEVGQDLAQWRPARDVLSSYSADVRLGGGVVFDLVHEIDMARWLLGPLRVHGAVGGRFGDLPIASDDVHVALLKTEPGVPVVVSLDYVSLQPVRKYAIVTTQGTFTADIMGKKMTLLDAAGCHALSDDVADFDVQETYQLQMMDWLAAIENPAHEVVSSFADAVKTADLMLCMQEATA